MLTAVPPLVLILRGPRACGASYPISVSAAGAGVTLLGLMNVEKCRKLARQGGSPGTLRQTGWHNLRRAPGNGLSRRAERGDTALWESRKVAAVEHLHGELYPMSAGCQFTGSAEDRQEAADPTTRASRDGRDEDSGGAFTSAAAFAMLPSSRQDWPTRSILPSRRQYAASAGGPSGRYALPAQPRRSTLEMPAHCSVPPPR